PAFANDGDGLAVEEELHPLFLGILHLATRAGHVRRIATIGAGHALGTLADGGTVAVHRGVATSEHHHLLALHVDEIIGGLLEAEVAVDVGDEEIQGIVHARQILTGETALHVGVGAHAHEHGVVVGQQLLDADVLAHLGIETELDAHAAEDFAATAEYALLQLELGDAEGEQAADLRVAVEHHRGHAIAYQHVGTTQAGRAGADDGDALAGRLDLGHVRPPAHGEGSVGDVLFHRADGHRAEAVVQGAGAFAQAILRADAAADFRQGVGLVGQLGGGEDVALGHQLEPVGNVVVDRALPLAVRVAAPQAAVCLLTRLLRLEGFVDLDEFLLALAQEFLLRVLATDLDELEVVVQTFAHFINLIGDSKPEAFRWKKTCRFQRSASSSQLNFLLRIRAGTRQQRSQVGRLRLDQPEATQVVVQVFQQFGAPCAAGLGHVFAQHALQVAAVGRHRLAGDALQIDQLVIHAVEEGVVKVQPVGEAAGDARAEVVPGLARHANETAGHVFAAVVARAFHHGIGTGVAPRETLTRGTGGEQLAAGGAVQAAI